MKFNSIKIAVLLFVVTFHVNAQNTLDNLGLTSSTPSSVAYSLRLLSSSYTGPLVRIKVGSSFYDVYPDASAKNFSLTSKISAVQSVYNSAVAVASANTLNSIVTSGTTDARVAIWYDQSGNSKDVLTSSAMGPKIITSGTIQTMNGQPSIYFASVSGGATLTSSSTVNYSTQTTATINAVVKNVGSTDVISGIYSTGPNGGWGLNYDSTATIAGYWIDGSGCWNATTGSYSTTIKIITGIVNISTSTSSIYENSVLKQTKNTLCTIANYTSDNLYIGSRGNSSTRVFDGYISEVILFPSNLSTANQSTLETNQSSVYLTVNPINTSSAASSTPTLCVNTALTNITHTTTGATGIGTAMGLPAGVTATFASNTITISGTPTVAGTFNYSIPLTGGFGNVNATGTITVNALPVLDIIQQSTITNGLNFDGVNDYVENTSLVITPSLGFTIEGWMKVNDLGFSAMATQTFNQYPAPFDMYVMNGTGKVSFLVGQANVTGSIQSSTALTIGTWTHLAFVYDPAVAKILIYINGTQDGIGDATPPGNVAGSKFIIGNRYDNFTGLNGTLDDVRIWNTARTQSQIQAAMNTELAGTETGLVAYYNFNQGVAGGTNTGISTLTDKTGNANNGTLNNFALSGAVSNWVGGTSAITTTSGSVTVNSAIQLNNTTSGGIWSTSNSGIASVSSTTGLVTGNTAGTATIYYTVTNSNNCSATVATSILVTITPTISNFGNVIKTVFDGSYTITPPNSNSSGAFTFTSSNTNVATITGTTVTILAPGSTTIRATQATDGYYIETATTATLTVSNITVVNSLGQLSNLDFNYINTDGKIGGGGGITAEGNAIYIKNILKIGDNYQGGIIGYILQRGDPGFDYGVQHGLIVAPSDQSTSVNLGTYGSGIQYVTPNDIGAGQSNTALVAPNVSMGGIFICDNLVLNSKTDWFLPSKNELMKIYENRAIIGGFIITGNKRYWTSSFDPGNSNFSFSLDFTSGIVDRTIKTNNTNLAVRAIRYF